jgi:hypothetical protein
MDPYFSIRMYLRDFGHPRSPLSSTTLVHRAFFCPALPTASVKEFESHMSEFESLLWPLGMMLPFVNTRNVLKNIVGWGLTPVKDRVLVLAGSKDTLMGVKLMRRMAQDYRKAFGMLVKRKLLQAHLAVAESTNKDDDEVFSFGVRFNVVEGAGHHMQNDLQWEDSASQLLTFVEQL